MNNTKEELLGTFLTRENTYTKSVSYKKLGKSFLERAIFNYRLFGLSYVRAQISRLPHLRAIVGVREVFLFGKKMRLPVKDAGTSVLAVYGISPHKSERKLAIWLIKNLSETDIFYDIGAHFGYYTALAERIVSQGEIHAFEASTRLCSYLKTNFTGTKNVRVVASAVAGAQGETNFYDASRSSDSSESSRFPVAGENIPPIKIQALTIDSYVKNGHKAPTVIKLDIEGGEEDAILGSLETLRNTSPRVIMEVWGGDKGKRYSDSAVKQLLRLGYEAFFIDKDGVSMLEPVTDPVGSISKRGEDARDNVLFFKNNQK
ncbi:MAG: FkbM family methyltransferase [Patescibacteria group bacterium]